MSDLDDIKVKAKQFAPVAAVAMVASALTAVAVRPSSTTLPLMLPVDRPASQEVNGQRAYVVAPLAFEGWDIRDEPRHTSLHFIPGCDASRNDIDTTASILIQPRWEELLARSTLSDDVLSCRLSVIAHGRGAAADRARKYLARGVP